MAHNQIAKYSLHGKVNDNSHMPVIVTAFICIRDN